MMTSRLAFWRKRKRDSDMEPVAEPSSMQIQPQVATIDLDIAPNDPFLTYCQHVAGVIEVEKLGLDSPAVRELRAANIRLVIPLVSQGDLIGLINLGERLSEQDYSSDDRKLLADLATQAAPAVRVAQLVQQQKIEAAERERIEQELKVARIIQQTLLPQSLPELEDWQIAAHWQPARAVGGDFYDFIRFPDGRLALIIADVTDKGVPAAMVMATSRSILRTAAEQYISPGQVLERANDMLCPDMPPKMFVTCLYILLDPATGRLCYANAGHNLPFIQRGDTVDELRATGMPLGLLPGMDYEEKETTISSGNRLLMYSDGLIEAHAPNGEMYGTPRLCQLLAETQQEEDLILYLLTDLTAFTGSDWDQEDDVTMVTLTSTNAVPLAEATEAMQSLAKFSIESTPGNERLVMTMVAEAVADIKIPADKLERVKTAVAEASMNAMEHGNKYQPDLPVDVEVLQTAHQLVIRICDYGEGQPIPETTSPDLEAKLEGMQSPRGWGLFLIKSMVDEMQITTTDHRHTLELRFELREGNHDSANA